MKVGQQSVGHPVDVASGAVYSTHQDLDLPGRMRLTWERQYRTPTPDSSPTALGPGWTTRYFATLTRHQSEFHFITPEGYLEIFSDHEDALERGEGIRNLSTSQELVKKDGRYLITRWDVNTGEIERYIFRDGRRGARWSLDSIEDITGQALDLIHDREGRLTSIRQRAEKRALTIEYTPNGWIQSIALLSPDAKQQIIARYEYDGHGRLSTAYDALGHADRYEYDASSRMTRETVKDGGVFYFKYDEKGRCIRTSGLDRYDEKALRFIDSVGWTEVTNSDGHVTRYQWLNTGQVIREIDPLGGMHQTEYDQYGRIISRVSPTGATIRYEYDERGDRCKIIDPFGHEYRITYNQEHLPVSLTDPAGNVWKREYDRANRLVATEDPLGGKYTVTYDSRGNAISIVAPTGGKKTQIFSENNVLLEVSDWMGNLTRYAFDDFGRVVERRGAADDIVRFRYDPLGNLLEASLPNGSSVRCTYDSGGNITRVTNSKGHTASYRYGSCRRLLETIDKSGGVVKYSWGTEPNRLEQITNEHGEIYSFTYDQAGRVISETGFDGRGQRFSYDLDGRCIARVNGNNERSTFKRDLAGRLIEGVLPDGSSFSFKYDVLGRLTSAINPDCEVTIERDPLGRVIREMQGEYVVNSYFDASGKLIRTTSNLGHQADYQIDHNGLLTCLTTGNRQSIEFVRNQLGQEVSRLLPGNVRLNQQYDAVGRLVEQRLGFNDLTATGGAIVQREYRYDNNSALISISDGRWGKIDYNYDPSEQLLNAISEVAGDERFNYDKAGNIVAATGDEERLYVPGNLLSQQGKIKYHYDDNGRLISKIENFDSDHPREWCYTWDGLDQLRSVRTPDNEIWHYGYDAFGRRVFKQSSARRVRFVWDRNVIIHEIENDRPASTWIFDHHTFKPLCKLQNGQVYPVITDHLGTPRELVDKAGNIVWAANYTAWGRVKSGNGGSVDCPIRFQGQWYDEESNLHYNRFRYYDPENGRFLSADPLRTLAGLNFYSYARNPIGWIDPFGLTGAAGCGDAGDSDADGKPLFRGERSSNKPEIVFNEGLHSKGDNMDLLRHATANQSDSGYIATSPKREIADGFAGRNGYVYEIRSSKGIDVNQTLGASSPFPEQAEVAIPRHVPPGDIVGAYPVRGGTPTGDFIPNPNYRGT